jgi:DNA-binding transcriptional regulator GbsR (MarR family)
VNFHSDLNPEEDVMSEELALVDDFGVHIGHVMGWPPAAGRAAGLLMLSETPLTSAQLQESLAASKGSISETTRLLITNGTVERFKEPGSRQYVYRWRDDAWIGCLRHQLDQTTELLALAERGYKRGLPAAQRKRLRQMRDYYRFMVEGLQDLLAEYSSRVESK